ncbi:MAG: hypothetical protein K8J31_24680 [Anaerolineae bacterium]|nr:hypothetical protein [Anaerolineae bacterium]
MLVKASLNELMDTEASGHRPRVTPARLNANIDHDVSMLRRRVEEALHYEGELVARVEALSTQLEQWDAQADEAVAQGKNETARHAVDQLQRVQQRLAIAESDLHEHRLVTQELIARVNQLEAAVAEAREAQPEADSDVQESSDALERAGKLVADVLAEMRERINELSEMIGPTAAPDEVSAPQTPDMDEAAIEDDLARRRDRLSKK